MRVIGISQLLGTFARHRALKAFGHRAGEAARQTKPIVIVQSCDDAYARFLEVTGPINSQYASRHSYAYCDFVGTASPVPNTANFNRYYLLRELLRLGRFHWALWMDVDAMVIDHATKLESVIQESEEKMLIICRGRPNRRHSINNGVFFLNLRHPLTVSMLRYVISVSKLAPRRHRCFPDDQRHMYRWLLDHKSQSGDLPFVKRYAGDEADRFNFNGSFIRHVFRREGTPAERIDKLVRLSQQVQAQHASQPKLCPSYE